MSDIKGCLGRKVPCGCKFPNHVAPKYPSACLLRDKLHNTKTELEIERSSTAPSEYSVDGLKSDIKDRKEELRKQKQVIDRLKLELLRSE